MKLKLVSVTTKIFLHAGRGCKPARRGEGEIKDGTMKSNSCGSSLNGSVAKVRGRRFHGRFSNNGMETVLPCKVVERRHQDKERELVDRPLSWE